MISRISMSARCIFLSIFFALWYSSVSAAPLLTIDVSDTSAVTFTATGNSSSVSFSEFGAVGFSLEDFFSGPTGIDRTAIASSSPNLRGGTNSYLFDLVGTGFANNASEDDLLFAGNEDVFYNMTTSDPAFTGSIILDLSAFSGLLRGVGTTGDIFHDFVPFEGVTFGTWEIVSGNATPVPLPSSLPLLLAGFGILGLVKRRCDESGLQTK